MNYNQTDLIKTPTLVLNERTARKNLLVMSQKAESQNIRFRPHFKTHQSALIGEWVREIGVSQITVSSVSMATYFARSGWRDILIAFPVNLRELADILELAANIDLSLLVESIESVQYLDRMLNKEVGVWIKIDTGMHRAGVWWEHDAEIVGVVEAVAKSDFLKLKGLLTHPGQTYHASSVAEILKMYSDSVKVMNSIRLSLEQQGFENLEVSVGDTPGCWLSDDLGNVDEIRPGNFIFFDAMMHNLGVCRIEDIAVAVACPIVAKHAHRNEIVIYGGAVHLSKEYIKRGGKNIYGYAAIDNGNGWQVLGDGNYVRALSQEHGIVHVENDLFNKVKIGDILYVIPTHVCLTVDALDSNYVII